ncbi:MAG: NUDIX domain-containing protein [Phenylobacterium sp.]|nr:MAG: NUDIX domain-containing protein [Phenylobacterium sp.]
MSVPQFGTPEPGRDYPDRPAAFAVVEQGGKIALVHVTFADGGGRVDLPGGGVDAGETEAEAAARECGEEAGLVVAPDEAFVRADHYFTNEKGVSRNTRGVFFTARLIGEASSLKVEEDHALVWTDPYEALVRLDRESHAWAVAAWLRRRTR